LQHAAGTATPSVGGSVRAAIAGSACNRFHRAAALNTR
jgi:hypothetical protein